MHYYRINKRSYYLQRVEQTDAGLTRDSHLSPGVETPADFAIPSHRLDVLSCQSRFPNK